MHISVHVHNLSSYIRHIHKCLGGARHVYMSLQVVIIKFFRRASHGVWSQPKVESITWYDHHRSTTASVHQHSDAETHQE